MDSRKSAAVAVLALTLACLPRLAAAQNAAESAAGAQEKCVGGAPGEKCGGGAAGGSSAAPGKFEYRKKLPGKAEGEIKCAGELKADGKVLIGECKRRNYDKYEKVAEEEGLVKDKANYKSAKHGKVAKALAYYKAAKKAVQEDKKRLEAEAPGSAAAKKAKKVLSKVDDQYKRAVKECLKAENAKVLKCPAAEEEEEPSGD